MRLQYLKREHATTPSLAMNEREAFIRGIVADLYNDTPRLAFADWLDEHGEHDRAEFIRVQCELEPIRDQYEIPRAAELHERENQLARGAGHGEFDLDKLREYGWDVDCEFRRGFPDILRVSALRFVEHGSELREALPTLRRVVVHFLNEWGERLAACAPLRGLPELELACWYPDDDMKALAASPHLADLRVLVLWLSRCEEEVGTDANLCKLAAKAKAWPKLRELVLLDPEGENASAVKKLVTSANRSAKRELAKYERGYPELFPLASRFYYDFPVAGRLPDGRAAVAELDYGPNAHRDSLPLGLVVTTFNDGGAPTGEVIRVPLPLKLANVKRGDASDWDGEYTKHLTEAIGFVPGFIRVRAGALGDFGPHRGHDDDWDQCGYPDDPEGATDVNGDELNIGGRIYHCVRNVEFVVSDNAWADKTGTVHST
jgi:uncharacterized protein (TIGR02996 family)